MRHTTNLLASIEVHEDIMQKNLGITRGAIVSEAVMMGLGKTLGRSYAHDLVYDLCREALKQERPLVELLAENEEVSKKLTKKELQSLCDPANYLGYSVEIVDKVLKQTVEQRSEPSQEMPGK
jgi:3-carboxy-cis,cis-muconate cycloisomerase